MAPMSGAPKLKGYAGISVFCAECRTEHQRGVPRCPNDDSHRGTMRCEAVAMRAYRRCGNTASTRRGVLYVCGIHGRVSDNVLAIALQPHE